MTTGPRRVALGLLVVIGLAMGACELNPQPLPPGDDEVDPGGGKGTGFEEPAAPAPPQSGATADAAVAREGGTDAGTDAAPDAPDDAPTGDATSD